VILLILSTCNAAKILMICIEFDNSVGQKQLNFVKNGLLGFKNLTLIVRLN
jgi:hypothetical protein